MFLPAKLQGYHTNLELFEFIISHETLLYAYNRKAVLKKLVWKFEFFRRMT